MPFRRAIGVLTLLAFAPLVSAGERWICLRSPNFELYTSASEKTGREGLRVFEEVRSAFRDILGVKLPDDKPVTIVAFRDEGEYAPYRVHPGVVAYYMPTPGHDFIVIQDLNPGLYPKVLHEYTHLVINQAGMKLPLWLNEGFAELYSTMQPMHGKILVGQVMPEHLAVAEAGLADLRGILDADSESKAYNENDRIGIFYAESWALVHMLKFSQDYSAGFERVLGAIGRGETSEKALESVYGKPIEAIQRDLKAYVHGNHFYEGVIDAKLEKPGSSAVEIPKEPFDTAVLLAKIQTRGPNPDQGIANLEKLAKANPGKPEPLEYLTWIRLASENPQSATATFKQALEAGTRDANLCYDYAVKLRTSIPDAEYVAALRRATEIDPGFSDAQRELAVHAINTKDYAEAVKRLHMVKKLDRANACTYYRALSFAAFQTGNAAEAKSAARQAQQYASSAEEHRLADEVSAIVNGGSQTVKPPELPKDAVPKEIPAK